MHRTWIELDERALLSNVETLRALAQGSRFCAVIKANAYGHGLKEVARILGRANVDSFAVDNIEEGRELRAMFPGAQIIVLGYTLLEQIPEAVDLKLEMTIYDEEHLWTLEHAAARLATTAPYHLKIETGTARQGVLSDHLPQFLSAAESLSHAKLVGISTHFANIEDTTDTRFAEQQFQLFRKAEELIRSMGFAPLWVHAACSAAIILYPETHGTLVRAGISLYGYWSSQGIEETARTHAISCELTPVLSWKTRIAQVKAYPAGTPIGYGMTEILKKASRIAVLPVGYADGYDRRLSSKGEVIIGGFRCRVVGRVCMNMLMVDVSNVPDVAPEMEALLLGRSGRNERTAADLAEAIDTIPYEILARLPAHIPRLVL